MDPACLTHCRFPWRRQTTVPRFPSTLGATSAMSCDTTTPVVPVFLRSRNTLEGLLSFRSAVLLSIWPPRYSCASSMASTRLIRWLSSLR